MSLINDALKRAKESQPGLPPPAPPLQLRPVEPKQTARHSVGILVPVLLALVALMGLLFVWQLVQKNTVKPAEANPPAQIVARAIAPTPAPAPAPAAEPPSP